MVAPPDGGWGWVVMTAAFINQMLLYGVLKSGGVMYMAIMDAMDVTHTQAAMVPSLAFSISAIMSPMSMTLSAYFSHRHVIFVGGLLAAFGMCIAAACSSSITLTTIFYGGFVGISCGLIGTPNIIVVYTYFDKHRAFASSFALAGGSIGCFFVPPLIEYFAKEHGLRVAFLAISALLLHICPCSLLFRPVESTNRIRRRNDPAKEHLNPDDTTMQPKENVSLELTRFEKDQSVKMNGVSAEETVLFLDPSETKGDDVVLSVNNNNNNNNNNKEAETTNQRQPSLSLCQRFLGVINMDFSIFRCKYFLMLMYTMAGFVFVWSGYLTLLPDYAFHESADEVTKTMAAFLLSAMSVGDLVFRIVFGWISDRGWLDRRHYVLLFLSISGGLLLCYTFTQTYALMMTNSVFFGIFVSGVIVLPPVLLNDFVGPNRFPMAYAVIIFINGLVMFGAAPLLACVREMTGSYKPCFLIMGLITLSAALIWLVDDVVLRLRPKTNGNSNDNS